MQTDIEYQTCQQGEWQDCWLISAVVGLAFKRPHEIQGMLQEAGDGSYEVTLPGQDPVVIRTQDEAKATSNGIWAQAIEAAIGRFTDVTAVRVFSFGEGISLLTGHSRTGYTNVTGAGFAPGWRVWSRSAWFEHRVADATVRNRLMVLGGSDGYWTTPKFDWLIPQHCYALLAYEPETRTCRIRNPYGNGDFPDERKRVGYGPGEFWLTPDEVQGSFCGFTVEDD